MSELIIQDTQEDAKKVHQPGEFITQASQDEYFSSWGSHGYEGTLVQDFL